MSVMYIRGGMPLEGELAVHGAKNSVLPILAACLLAKGPVTLTNCPQLTDVTAALGILRHLGCQVEQEGNTIVVDPTGAAGSAISEEQMRSMRSSIIFLGPLLARTGEAHLSYPGGCELGPRPIDLHLSAIRAMGCYVTEDQGIHCQGRPVGGEVQLALPSVGATENAILCAVGGMGQTTITNAAREPEIGDLQSFLNSLGASVRGAGSSTIMVEGGRPLSGGTFRRVTFEDCKMVGALLPESSLTDVRFAGCAARYINCYEAAVHRVQFIGCDLTGAVLQSVSVRELAFSESRLTSAELFGTPLAGVDFTTSEIDGIVVAPQNLRGAVVTAPQACELARLLGVIIR